jgi:hypothetical protein
VNREAAKKSGRPYGSGRGVHNPNHKNFLSESGVSKVLQFGPYDLVTEVRISYSAKRSNSSRRNISFELSLDDYVKYWFEINPKTGRAYWFDKGKNSNSYQMMRKNDIGPYRLDNLIYGTMFENSSFAHKGRKGNNRTPKPEVAKKCEGCGVDFVVSYGDRRRRFCCKSCSCRNAALIQNERKRNAVD